MSNENIEIVKKCYDAFGRGDLPELMSHMSEDLTRFGLVSSYPSAVPWYVPLTKKGDVPRFFELLVAAVDHTKFEPFAFAAAGDYVYASIKLAMKVRKTGREVDLNEAIHRIRFKDGKVVEWRLVEDTAATDAAFR